MVANPRTPRTAADLREAFLRFFEQRGHRRVPSASLVPDDDPTVLFTSAGINQFKEAFSGRATPKYPRAVSCQKCARAGGKHYDLENVGFNGRHLTFFEMLGSFSWGSYFKEEAIDYAWELITEVVQLPIDRLAVSVFRDDDEAALLWRARGVRAERVFRFDERYNFWTMGRSGPRGPCSDLYFFRLPHDHTRAQIDAHAARYFGDDDESEDGPEAWMSFWQLVFVQLERKLPNGPSVPLPTTFIDTGAGLERLVTIAQGARTVYDTDLMQPLIREAARVSGQSYAPDEPTAMPGPSASMRVVADHARTVAFLIADGVSPSNEGRGFVLRRILRRAIRHAQQLTDEPSLFERVCDVVVDEMGDAYPELRRARESIHDAVTREIHAFARTLRRGRAIVADAIAANARDKRIPGDVAFRLYDTHGFPLDLTQAIACESGYSVDTEGFEEHMQQQRARSQFIGSGETPVSDPYKSLAAELPPAEFLGYDQGVGVASARVAAALVAGRRVERVECGASAELFFDRTPFYGESGGQLGDRGVVVCRGARADVVDTQKPVPGLVVHKVDVVEGTIGVGDTVELFIDAERRRALRANHSATHLLHLALRELLGPAVKQAGSVVASDHLRFDFTSHQPLGDEERAAVEDRVNQLIRENHEAETQLMTSEEALRSGALACFGDKYGQLGSVRVLRIGPSRELCGGTHVARSGDLGLFKIVRESAIAAGVRRIVAVTGPQALAVVREQEAALACAASTLRCAGDEVPAKLEQLTLRVEDLERELRSLSPRATAARAVELAKGARTVNGVRMLAVRTDCGDIDVLRELADNLRGQLNSGIIVLGGEKEDKASLVVAVTRDLAVKYGAGDLIKELVKTLGGRGGGKSELAQAGGGDPRQLDATLERAYLLV